MTPDRFEPLRAGRLELVVQGLGGPAKTRGYGFAWGDSGWVPRWTLEAPYHVFWPALTPIDHQMLVWIARGTAIDVYYVALMTADVGPDGVIGPPDTVAHVSAAGLVYAGTSWGTRRWVAVRDQDFTVLGFPEVLRIYRSTGRGPWQRMGSTGLTGRWGMSMVALDSSTVMLLSGEWQAGIHWGYLRDTTFTEETPVLGGNPASFWPRFNRTPTGGFVAAWEEYPRDSLNFRVVLRRFLDGVWSPIEEVPISFPEPNQYFVDDVQVDAAGGEGPALAWSGYSPNHLDAADYLWAAIPADTGLGIGERLDMTRGGVNPTLVRDESGDVWLAWWEYLNAGCFWMHTYTSAMSAAPTLGERSGRPELRWVLDQPARGTWWDVLRAVAGGPWEQVARVRAGDSQQLAWTDDSAPTDRQVRYAIERESRDKRYVARTSSVEWHPRTARLDLSLRSANPGAQALLVDVIGARAGPLEAALFDLQGRRVARVTAAASGSGRDTIRLEVEPGAPSGLYWLSVRGAGGAISAPRKVAILR